MPQYKCTHTGQIDTEEVFTEEITLHELEIASAFTGHDFKDSTALFAYYVSVGAFTKQEKDKTP